MANLRGEAYLRNMFAEANSKYPHKHYADCGDRLILGDFVEELADRIDRGEESKQLCTFLDKEFLFGAWAQELQDRSPVLLKNLRGLIISAYEEGKKRGADNG